MQKIRPLNTHFLIHSSVCWLLQRWTVHYNMKLHFPEFPEEKKIRMRTVWENIFLFNTIQTQSVLLSETDFLDVDKKITLTLQIKILTILINKRNFSQGYLNTCTEVCDTCNLKIFHKPRSLISNSL